MLINVNINGFNTPIELPEIFAEREQIQTSDDSYVIRQGNLVEVGGVLTIQTTPVTKGTGTEGSKRVDLSSYGFTKILNVQATAEDTPAGSIHENAHVGDVSAQGFTVYATSTHTAPVEFKVRYFVRAIV
jgi:hypothetical protein|nr:MAG TPA: hypothetical protein [Caudoviricetes sp.]